MRCCCTRPNEGLSLCGLSTTSLQPQDKDPNSRPLFHVPQRRLFLASLTAFTTEFFFLGDRPFACGAQTRDASFSPKYRQLYAYGRTEHTAQPSCLLLTQARFWSRESGHLGRDSPIAPRTGQRLIHLHFTISIADVKCVPAARSCARGAPIRALWCPNCAGLGRKALFYGHMLGARWVVAGLML